MSACNPPCAAGQQCTGEGQCVATAPAPAPAATPVEPMYFNEDYEEPKANWKRASKGKMVAGIILTSVGGLALLVGGLMLAAGDQRVCDSQGFCVGQDYTARGLGYVLVGGVGVGIGIPLLVSGAKRVPAEAAFVVGPRFTGLHGTW